MIKRFFFQVGLPFGQSVDEPTMQIVGEAIPEKETKDDLPSFVVLPDALGGQQVNVTEAIGFQPCVHRNCKCRHPTMLLQKWYPDGRQLAVMECGKNGFLWHKREVD
tara:strand:- start:200 stop:520 length:321 start_codon:yes stop_codon:yes gene_type:complete